MVWLNKKWNLPNEKVVVLNKKMAFRMRSWKCMVFTTVKNASRNLVSQGFIAGTLPGCCPTLGRPLELGGQGDPGEQKSHESSMESYISRLVGGHPVPLTQQLIEEIPRSA